MLQVINVEVHNTNTVLGLQGVFMHNFASLYDIWCSFLVRQKKPTLFIHFWKNRRHEKNITTLSDLMYIHKYFSFLINSTLHEAIWIVFQCSNVWLRLQWQFYESFVIKKLQLICLDFASVYDTWHEALLYENMGMLWIFVSQIFTFIKVFW